VLESQVFAAEAEVRWLDHVEASVAAYGPARAGRAGRSGGTGGTGPASRNSTTSRTTAAPTKESER